MEILLGTVCILNARFRKLYAAKIGFIFSFASIFFSLSFFINNPAAPRIIQSDKDNLSHLSL